MLVELRQLSDPLVLVEQHQSQNFDLSSRWLCFITVAAQDFLGLIIQTHFEFISHFVYFGEFEMSQRNLAFNSDFKVLRDWRATSVSLHLGLIVLRIAEEMVRDIILHGFVNSLLLHLRQRTCSSRAAVGPIAVREGFAELHRFLLHQRGLMGTIEAGLNCRNATSPKVILECSVDQQDFSFVQTAPDQDSNLPFQAMD